MHPAAPVHDSFLRRPPARPHLHSFPYTTLFRSLIAFVLPTPRTSVPPLTTTKETCIGTGLSGVLIVSIPVQSALTRIALGRSEEHTSELQSRPHLVCRLPLEKIKRSG